MNHEFDHSKEDLFERAGLTRQDLISAMDSANKIFNIFLKKTIGDKLLPSEYENIGISHIIEMIFNQLSSIQMAFLIFDHMDDRVKELIVLANKEIVLANKEFEKNKNCPDQSCEVHGTKH